MTVSIFSAAKKICELGNWSVTNLQLQKILYLANMIYMGKNNGELLVSSHFEAWDYGPVAPDLYHEFKKYGGNPIRTGFFHIPDVKEDSPECKELQMAAKHLLFLKPGNLVAFTHRKGGAWEKHYVPGKKGIIIPSMDILEEYKGLKK